MQETSFKKAFDYEKGQFICHIYAKVEPSAAVRLEDIAIAILAETSGTWESIPTNQSSEDPEFHVTLVRGHRAIYYHQIKPLVDKIKSAVENIGPFSLCLDKLKIFDNCEQSKQFLCLTNSGSTKFQELKSLLRVCIDTFATRLTGEDETPDTVAHCSILQRDMSNARSTSQQLNADLARALKICDSRELNLLEDCFVTINKIYIKVGNKEYPIELS